MKKIKRMLYSFYLYVINFGLINALYWKYLKKKDKNKYDQKIISYLKSNFEIDENINTKCMSAPKIIWVFWA